MNRINLRTTFSAVLLLFLVACSSRAMSVVPRDFDQLVARADTVFRGTVTDQRCLWKGEGRTRRIMTLVTLRVEETFKGEAAVVQTIELLGGSVGNQRIEIPGMPKFS